MHDNKSKHSTEGPDIGHPKKSFDAKHREKISSMQQRANHLFGQLLSCRSFCAKSVLILIDLQGQSQFRESTQHKFNRYKLFNIQTQSFSRKTLIHSVASVVIPNSTECWRIHYKIPNNCMFCGLILQQNKHEAPWQVCLSRRRLQQCIAGVQSTDFIQFSLNVKKNISMVIKTPI